MRINPIQTRIANVLAQGKKSLPKQIVSAVSAAGATAIVSSALKPENNNNIGYEDFCGSLESFCTPLLSF